MPRVSFKNLDPNKKPAKAMEALKLQGYSSRQLGILLKISNRYAAVLCSSFHRHGLAHVQRWIEPTTEHPWQCQAVYRWGPGEDAERPKPLTTAQKSKRARELKKFRTQALPPNSVFAWASV